ncbi:MAG TPA: winged helix DNA-binding domain-containing protein [Propionibacteriaceae bacterium]|nr:winged helix DNA-binding domain-containing protein [Propionibacteriaceae bacterium]
MTDELPWSAANVRRLQRHALLPPAATGTDPAAIAAVICGAHAQVLSAAELSLAVRIQEATRTTIQHALWDDHRLIKTYGPRGTVHLLDTEDLPLWTAALSAIPAQTPFPDGVRLTPAQAEEIVDAIGRALEDAELTIDELDRAVVDLVGAWAGDRVMPAFQDLWPRWRQAVGMAAHRGVLCFGPNRGRRVTYTNPRRWLPGFDPALVDEAIGKVIARYLYAYGPATPNQFAQWIGAPPSWANEQFERHSQNLTKINFSGVSACVAGGDIEMPAEAEAKNSVLLLPYFDAYVVGSHPRDRLFTGKAATRALAPSGQAGNYPVLLIDGVVAGVWHQRRSGRKVNVTVEPLTRLTGHQRRALEAQVERLGEILEGQARLTIGTVTTGGHA